jgi:hypothetical protein
MAISKRIEMIAKGLNVVYQRYCKKEPCRKAMNEMIGSLLETLKVRGEKDKEDFLIHATRRQLSIFPAQTELLKPKMPLGGK